MLDQDPRKWPIDILFAGVEPLLGLLPIHHIPPRRYILRPPPLVFQVVSVLPDIQANHRKFVFHERAILIGGGNNIDLPTIFDQPGPARSKPSGGGGADLLLERRNPAERAVDRRRQIPGRLAASLGPDDRPEHRVVVMSTAVVAHGGPDILGNDGAVV